MIYFNFSMSSTPNPMVKIVICIPVGFADSRACVFVFKHSAVVVDVRCIKGLFSRLVLLEEFTD